MGAFWSHFRTLLDAIPDSRARFLGAFWGNFLTLLDAASRRDCLERVSTSLRESQQVRASLNKSARVQKGPKMTPKRPKKSRPAIGNSVQKGPKMTPKRPKKSRPAIGNSVQKGPKMTPKRLQNCGFYRIATARDARPFFSSLVHPDSADTKRYCCCCRRRREQGGTLSAAHRYLETGF